MGGHSSKQSVSVSTSVVATAVQSATQNCLNYISSGNTVSVAGSGNVIDDVGQTMAISVDSKCAADVTQSADFSTNLQSNVSQQLKDQSVALTQWLDNSKTRNSTAINQSVATNVTSTTVQTCLNNLDAQNIVAVAGSGNVVSRVLQDGTVNLVSKCLLGQGQTSTAVNDITNSVNQHSEYTSKNPLAFISDAFESLFESAAVLAAVIFIALLSFVLLFVYLKRRKDRKMRAGDTTAAKFESNTG